MTALSTRGADLTICIYMLHVTLRVEAVPLSTSRFPLPVSRISIPQPRTHCRITFSWLAGVLNHRRSLWNLGSIFHSRSDHFSGTVPRHLFCRSWLCAVVFWPSGHLLVSISFLFWFLPRVYKICSYLPRSFSGYNRAYLLFVMAVGLFVQFPSSPQNLPSCVVTS